MNYYQRHIGDYLRDTAHLSLLEHGVYARLLDVYYTREQPFAQGEASRLVGARTKDERAAVESVLAEFFADGRHARCDREIAAYKARSDHNQRVGKLGGRPRKFATKSEPEHDSDAAPQANEATPGGSVAEPERNPPGYLREPEPNPPINQEPIEIPPIPPKGGKPAIGLKAWLDAVKAAGKAPIPDDDPVFAYAEEVGIPADFLRLAWLEFRHRYTQPEAKRYRDWRSVFRKAVRGNWGKLWWLDPSCGQYALTTVGMQAQRAHQERRQA